MSRPPTPLKVLEARGSIKKNPQRYRGRLAAAASAPTLSSIGDPPARWEVRPEEMGALRYARLKSIWNEFGPQIPDATPMKRALLEMFCEAMERFRRDAASMKASEKSYLLQLTCKLGIDSRSHGSKNPEGSEGDWEAFG